MGQTIVISTIEGGSVKTCVAGDFNTNVIYKEFVILNNSYGPGETLTVNGIEGKLYSLTSGEQQGYIAIFIANGKEYKISYFADSKEFENNKDLVKSVITSAEFS